MLTANSGRARQVTAGAVLACTALLVSACNSSSSSTAASSASTPAGSPTSAGAPAPAGSPSLTTAPTGASTFLAPGQDINSTALHEPACHSGCPLSGDSTATLSRSEERRVG